MGWLKDRNRQIKELSTAMGEDFNHRRTGSSTALALRTVSEAMLNIEKSIYTGEHTYEILYVVDVIKSLGFEGFHVSGEGLLIYSLNEEFEKQGYIAIKD